MIDGAKCFKIKVEISDSVPAGCSATLLCKYTLPIKAVYSVKWYRGSYEFYRYLPVEHPPDKSFDKPGILVQMELSNATQVTLKNVTQALAGPFTCEVSGEEPTFITWNHTAMLYVYELSKVQRPLIRTDELVYRIGKPFFVICSLPIYPRVGLLTTSYTMNVYHDEQKIDSKSVTIQTHRTFVVAAHLLKWNLSAASNKKCFECEISVCEVHRRRSEKKCVPFTSGSSSVVANFVNGDVYDFFNIIRILMVAIYIVGRVAI